MFGDKYSGATVYFTLKYIVYNISYQAFITHRKVVLALEQHLLWNMINVLPSGNRHAKTRE